MPIYKTDKKKNGIYIYRVVVSYVDSDGKNRQKERRVLGAAEAKEVEKELSASLSAPGNLPRIADLYAEFLRVKKHELRQSSYKKLNRLLVKYIVPYFGKTRVDRITRPMLQRWKNNIAELNKSHSTNKAIYAALRALLSYAVKMEYIALNPLIAIGNFKKADIQKKEIQYYTPEQFVQYIGQIKTDTMQGMAYYTFFCIAYLTGMRKGEINALTWEDIDGDIIHVRRSVSIVKHGEDIFSSPKTSSSIRDIQIPENLKTVLQKQKEVQQRQPRWSKKWLVCGGIYPIRNATLNKQNRKYSEAAGLPNIRIHDFRHSHASLLAHEGINIQEIARRLGHSDVSMTWNTYSHLYPSESEHAVSVLNKINC